MVIAMHVTNAFRGAAHIECNVNYKQLKNIPVIVYILKHYDGHQLMSALGKFKDYHIDVKANTIENS